MGELTAVLTGNRKNAKCPGCHRLLAYRARQGDGAFLLFLDPDWRVEQGDRYIGHRNWRHSQRHPGYAIQQGLVSRLLVGGPAGSVLPPVSNGSTWLECGCGDLVHLDPAALDVTIDLSGRWDELATNAAMIRRRGPGRIVRPPALLPQAWRPPRVSKTRR